MRNVLFVMFIAGALALAAPAAEPETDKALGRPGCAWVLASSAEEHDGAFAKAFSATRTVDLTLTVLLPQSVAEEHVVELRIYTPTGNLYQSLAVPVAAPGRVKAENRTLPGYPRAKKQVLPKAFTYEQVSYYRVDIPFPVGGTLITSNGLYGGWRIAAHLDGSGEPCGKAALVTIAE
jgi:hypothetical protein